MIAVTNTEALFAVIPIFALVVGVYLYHKFYFRRLNKGNGASPIKVKIETNPNLKPSINGGRAMDIVVNCDKNAYKVSRLRYLGMLRQNQPIHEPLSPEERKTLKWLFTTGVHRDA